MRPFLLVLSAFIHCLVFSQNLTDSFIIKGVILNGKTKEVVKNATLEIVKNDTTINQYNLNDTFGFNIKLIHGNSYLIYAFKKFYFDSEQKVIDKSFSDSIKFIDFEIDPFGEPSQDAIIVFFDFASVELTDTFKCVLDTLVRVLNNHPNIEQIGILGEADCNELKKNKKVSYERAIIVKKYLTEKGINKKRLKIIDRKDSKLLSRCCCDTNSLCDKRFCNEDDLRESRAVKFEIIKMKNNKN